MYNPGDYVVVPGYGVCRIDSVGHPSLSPADVNVDYYTLSPLNEKCRIHIPCSASDGRMRPVIMKDKALALLAGIPSMQVNTRKNKLRLKRYQDAINDGRPEALLPMIMEIYRSNIDRLSKGKGFGNYTESAFFRKAEGMFNEEISLAIGCKPEEVNGIIKDLVKTAERQNEVIT